MSWRLRSIALLGVASFTMHQLRYWLVHGDAAGAVMAQEGHAYFGALVPLLAVLLGAALLDFALALFARADRATPPSQRWLAVTLTLLAIYVAQETAEGALSAGHAEGLAAVFGDGGWVVVPLAAIAGALVTLALRGAAALLAHIDRSPRRARHGADLRQRPRMSDRHVRSVMAANLAGRGPPLSVSI